MALTLFVILNAVLFVRPAEIVQPLEGLPIYELLIVACFVATGDRLRCQFSIASLQANPVTTCVLGLVLSAMLSHLQHLRISEALHGALEMGKLASYFLLLNAIIDTPRRLRTFLLFLVAFIGVAAILALLQWHGIIDVAALAPIEENDWNASSGQVDSFYRLCSTGIFHDPNDLSLILVVGICWSFYFIFNAKSIWKRTTWAMVIGVFGYALALTRSRGGMLALMSAIGVMFFLRYSTKKAVAIAVLVLPAVLYLFGGRQTNIDLQDGTGQARIQLWAEGLTHLRSSPLFGIGIGRYADELGLVAHNSYIHCYTELGWFGGTLFVGAFYFVLWPMHLVRTSLNEGKPFLYEEKSTGQCMRTLHPYLMASVVGYAVGMLSLSRAYVVPTYLMLGLVAAYLNIVREGRPDLPRFERRLAFRLAGVSTAFMVTAYVFIRFAVRWS